VGFQPSYTIGEEYFYQTAIIVSVMHHHEEGALSSEMELQALKERGVEAVNKVSHSLYHYSDNSRTIFSWRAWYRQTTPKSGVKV